MSEARACVSVVLAAGAGTRMKSDMPKVLHEVCGLPMLALVLDAMKGVGVSECVVVIGCGADMVRSRFADWDEPLKWVEQMERKGTGHAVMMTEDALAGFDGDVVVVCGDNPLLSSETVAKTLDLHRKEGAACTVVTSEVDNPTGYGRIVRGADGSVAAIVEERDTTDEQKIIREVNSGNYVFDVSSLFDALKDVGCDNDQGEYYLTDVVAVLRSKGKKVMSNITEDASEVLGINSRAQLAEAGEILQRRIKSQLMIDGVTIVSPSNTFIDPRATIGIDTVIMPFSVIEGPCSIGAGCRIGPFAHVRAGSSIEDGTEVTGSKECQQ